MSREKGRGSGSATQRFVEALEERTLLSAAVLKDIQTATASSSPSSFAALGSSLLFYADDGINGRELWRLDSGGAARLTNLHLPANVTLGRLQQINQYVYFAV